MTILFVKLGAIGDALQAAAAVKEFRRRNPLILLDWVAGRQIRPLVDALGVADRVFEVDDKGLLGSSVGRRLIAFGKAVATLVSVRKYDVIITAHSDYRYSVLSIGVRARRRVRFRPKSRRPSPIQQRNRVQEYWRLLTGNDAEQIDIATMMQALGEGLKKSPAGSAAGSLSPGYIVLAAGGARNFLRDDMLRRWPIHLYRLLAERLIATGRRVVLVGAESDRWVLGEFGSVPVVDLIGKTSLLDVLPLLAAAGAVVTNDSGILHLSVITQTGIVALFGPTPSNAVIPYGRKRTVIVEEGNRVSCSPCYDGKTYAECSRPVCLEAISVERVFDAVNLLTT